MLTVPAHSFCAPARAKLIAALRSIPGDCGVLPSSEWPGITRTPSCFHLGSVMVLRSSCPTAQPNPGSNRKAQLPACTPETFVQAVDRACSMVAGDRQMKCIARSQTRSVVLNELSCKMEIVDIRQQDSERLFYNPLKFPVGGEGNLSLEETH